MSDGIIRDWRKDSDIFFTHHKTGRRVARRKQALFRRRFRTKLLAQADHVSPPLEELAWGERVELPAGLSSTPFTQVRHDGQSGFVLTEHVCELAYAGPAAATPRNVRKKIRMRRHNRDDLELIWGDIIQVLEWDGDEARVRARGWTGRMDRADMQAEPLLDVYFIDVGQGDGALIRFPNGRHMMIDGGQARSQQMSGKNAADLVDWKFFVDYGEWEVDLDWMIASHSDVDHFGGLADLISTRKADTDGLDCLSVRVRNFGHPGLSRFPTKVHYDRLGPVVAATDATGRSRKYFTALLKDRDSASDYSAGTNQHGDNPDNLKFSGPWGRFVASLLKRGDMNFVPLSLDHQSAAAGHLPRLDIDPDCPVFILGPVTEEVGGDVALRDLGPTGKNTNGHSVCLRLDMGDARILMTGDLNALSMEWLSEAFDDRMPLWRSDVAKACHHGANDVRFSFLSAINAAATVISSGDNEGHAHPTPQIVAASALSGRVELSPDGEDIVTPLIFMTEIERSAMLSEVNRLELSETGQADNVLLAKPLSELSGSEYLDQDRLDEIERINRSNNLTKTEKKAERKRVQQAAKQANGNRFSLAEDDRKTRRRSGVLYGNRPTGTIGTRQVSRSLDRLRMLEKTHYGMVTVRTDGKTILCATKRDDGETWNLNSFAASAGV